MKLKKFLSILLLGPIMPIIGIPDEGGESKGGEGDGGENNNNTGGKDEKDNSSGNNNKKNNEETKYLSQEDFDKAFEKRLARERKNIEKEFNDKLEREKMTENEKLQSDLKTAEKNAEIAIKTANDRLIKSEVNMYSTKLGIIDNDAAYALIPKDDIEVDKNGNVSGVEDALKALISKKTWLVKTGSGENDKHRQTGDDQSGGNDKSKKFNMNDAIRKAAGR